MKRLFSQKKMNQHNRKLVKIKVKIILLTHPETLTTFSVPNKMCIPKFINSLSICLFSCTCTLEVII